MEERTERTGGITNRRGKMYSKKERIHSTDKTITEKGKKYSKE